VAISLRACRDQSHVGNVDQLTNDDVSGAQSLYGSPSPVMGTISPRAFGTVAFPARNESFDFRTELEAKYRWPQAIADRDLRRQRR
jgi:hypothetical protein